MLGGLRLLLFLVLVLGARGGGSSQPEKWRVRLKALLYEYKNQRQEEPSRQVCNQSTSSLMTSNPCNACCTTRPELWGTEYIEAWLKGPSGQICCY